LNLLCEGCHVGSILPSVATDQDTVVPGLCQLRHSFVPTRDAQLETRSASAPRAQHRVLVTA
jgi:hypothetical protein